MNVGDAFSTDARMANRARTHTDSPRQAWHGCSRSLRRTKPNLNWLRDHWPAHLAVARSGALRDRETAGWRGSAAHRGWPATARRHGHRQAERRHAPWRSSVDRRGHHQACGTHLGLQRNQHPLFRRQTAAFRSGLAAVDTATPGSGWVRIFYLPRSRRVVNVEALNGPPDPEMTPASAQDLAQSMLSACGHTLIPDSQLLRWNSSPGGTRLHVDGCALAQPPALGLVAAHLTKQSYAHSFSGTFRRPESRVLKLN